MTDNEMRIKIAEACGWKFTHTSCRYGTIIHATKEGCGPDNFPDYPNDLNACHEMEKTLKDCNRYLNKLKAVIDFSAIEKSYDLSVWELTTATARQRCEAFLRTLNLWED